MRKFAFSLALGVVAAFVLGTCLGNMSLPPGMDLFGPQVDENLFRHEFEPRKCTVWDKPLLRWLKEYGAEFEGIEIKSIEGKGCGLVATQLLRKDAHIIKLPLRVAWTRESASAANLGKEFDNLSPVEQLIVFAATEHATRNKSMWAPYIDSTPTVNEFTNVLFWTEAERNMLQGSHLVAYTKTIMREVEGIHTSALKMFKRMRKVNVTVEDVIWAWGLVHSRQVTFGDRSLQAVAPLIDLINSGPKWNVRVETAVERNKNFLMLIANSDISKGDELLLSQPRRENAYLAHNLGVAVTNNTNDNRLIFFPTSFNEFVWGKDHQESEVRKEFYKYLKFDQPGKEWFYSAVNGSSYDLINAARARMIRVDDVHTASGILPSKKMVNKVNEWDAINQILNMTLEREKKYNTSPEEDRALLASGTLNQRQRMAVQIRLGEKLVLKECVTKMKGEMAELSSTKKKTTKPKKSDDAAAAATNTKKSSDSKKTEL